MRFQPRYVDGLLGTKEMPIHNGYSLTRVGTKAQLMTGYIPSNPFKINLSLKGK